MPEVIPAAGQALLSKLENIMDQAGFDQLMQVTDTSGATPQPKPLDPYQFFVEEIWQKGLQGASATQRKDIMQVYFRKLAEYTPAQAHFKEIFSGIDEAEIYTSYTADNWEMQAQQINPHFARMVTVIMENDEVMYAVGHEDLFKGLHPKDESTVRYNHASYEGNLSLLLLNEALDHDKTEDKKPNTERLETAREALKELSNNEAQFREVQARLATFLNDPRTVLLPVKQVGVDSKKHNVPSANILTSVNQLHEKDPLRTFMNTLIHDKALAKHALRQTKLFDNVEPESKVKLAKTFKVKKIAVKNLRVQAEKVVSSKSTQANHRVLAIPKNVKRMMMMAIEPISHTGKTNKSINAFTDKIIASSGSQSSHRMGERVSYGASIGAVVGAVLGGLAGIAFGPMAIATAAVGAAVGAGVGALVGYISSSTSPEPKVMESAMARLGAGSKNLEETQTELQQEQTYRFAADQDKTRSSSGYQLATPQDDSTNNNMATVTAGGRKSVSTVEEPKVSATDEAATKSSFGSGSPGN